MIELEQHHVKYLERDGKDEIILVTPDEHRRIHRRLKAQGVLPVSKRIRDDAHNRSPVGKATSAEYAQSDEGKMHKARYERSEKGKAARKRYRQSEKGRTVDRATSARYKAKQKTSKPE